MIPSLSGRGSRPRLCFVSYRHMSRFAMPVLDEYASRAEIEVIDGSFDAAVDAVRERIRQGSTDAFLSAGANAAVLRQTVDAPVATIKLGGFDILLALMKARHCSDRVGVITFGRTIPELDAVKEMLRIEVAQYAYRTPQEARQCFQLLRREGFNVVVGSSIVVELAEQHGIQGMLAYSLSAVRQGIEDAIELARVARLEAGRYEQLNGVLHNLQEAVLAVDRDNRAIAVNPPMARLLGRSRQRLLGQRMDDLAPELSLEATLESGQEDRAAVLRYAQRDWIANRTPIREHGDTVGAAITLYDARSIQEADATLRTQQRSRQPTARYRFENLVGASPAFQRACATARRFARTDLTVLISGESGAGKELFAQAIHNESARAGRPFVAVNCASLPESLLESELFGYEDGAFTGSRRGGKRGLFEAAHTGTLFLDEIGDMPVSLQTRLLRVLQEREVVRLGGTVPIPVDVRIVAATHQPLAELMRERRFRQDLYYRINTLHLPLPALRERREDIAPLALTLVQRCLHRLGSERDAGRALAPLLGRLAAYDWPGNVRELENLSERIAVFLIQFDGQAEVDYTGLRHDCPELYAEHGSALSAPLRGINPGETANHAEPPPRARLHDMLRETGGNRQETARRLGISRATLWRWMREADAQRAAALDD
ncbi:propionate catabolism operon regulatory protein [plant metagenome]